MRTVHGLSPESLAVSKLALIGFVGICQAMGSQMAGGFRAQLLK